MMQSNMKALTILCLFVFAVPAYANAQKLDPFSSNGPTVSGNERARRPEKVVVHTPTLDLCFRWFEMNFGLVEIQRRIRQTEKKIESVEPEASPEALTKLQEQLAELRRVNESTRTKLDRIPLDSTFDLERWGKFKRQLAEMRMQESERTHIRDHLSRENDRLRNENQQLRNEIARLKSGR